MTKRRDPKEYEGNSFTYKANKHDWQRQKKSEQPWVPRRRPVEKIVPDILETQFGDKD